VLRSLIPVVGTMSGVALGRANGIESSGSECGCRKPYITVFVTTPKIYEVKTRTKVFSYFVLNVVMKCICFSFTCLFRDTS